MSAAITPDGLILRLRGLKLPAFVSHHGEIASRAEREGWSFVRFLGEMVEIEHREREVRRIDRLRKNSGLDKDKTLATLDLSRLPVKVKRQVPTLCEGGFVDRAENLLAFGLPGRGKSHLLTAIGHELVQRGYSVLCVPTFKLVHQLLQAKRDLTLLAAMRRLDQFDAVLLDDIGYTQQNREEMEVLFNFLAERYERRSVMITSNLVFSQWDKIFKDAMTTAAAIDRIVHHSIILELTGRSYRGDEAEKRNQSSVAASSKSETTPA
jgi:DNA replication protein DnaC